MSEISPYIQSRIGGGSYFDIQDEESMGSVSAAANQQFDVSLASIPGVVVGQKVVVYACEFRGDFSAANEFVSVGFGLTTNPKVTVGAFVATDSSVYAVDNNIVGTEFDVVDIGGGSPGIRMFISPEATVNFSPGGMPNGWWWQLRMSFRAIS